MLPPLSVDSTPNRTEAVLSDEYRPHPVTRAGRQSRWPLQVPASPTPSVSQSPLLPKSVACLLYTSDAADDLLCVDLGGRGVIKNSISARPLSMALPKACGPPVRAIQAAT